MKIYNDNNLTYSEWLQAIGIDENNTYFVKAYYEAWKNNEDPQDYVD